MPTGLVTVYIIAWISPLLACLSFSFLVLISSLISIYGVFSKNFSFMMIASAFCGFGAEANEIAQYTLISIWFQGKFLSLAGGLVQFINNLGMTLSMLFTSQIYEFSRSLLTVYSLVGFCCSFSVIGICVFSYFDIKYGKPTSVERGGSSINPNGEKVDCKSWKYLNNKLVWYSIINTWFSQ